MKKGNFRVKLGNSEIMFLQLVWGPLMDYDFTGLHAEFPLTDLRGGRRFVDFMFENGRLKLLIEIDGYTTHARDITPGEFNDHLRRQNELLLKGWLLLRFSPGMMEREPDACAAQIMQALGLLWNRQYKHMADGDLTWADKRMAAVEHAKRHGGTVKPSKLAEEMKVQRYTVSRWMKRYVKEGWFVPVKGDKRIVGYRLVSGAGGRTGAVAGAEDIGTIVKRTGAIGESGVNGGTEGGSDTRRR
ncbi:MarR family transcriptional regulator [Paenibacillus sp. TRM 82003]|nr:MarR family transcriptional regulator [Paenibacillus sp. TRM 82003]